MKYFLLLVLSLLPSSVFAVTNPTEPDSAKGLLDQVAGKAGYTTVTSEATRESLLVQIAGAINLILGFLGVIFVILVIYAGFLYMTARGNDEQVTRAQDYIKNSVIGLILIFTAFVTSNEVLKLLAQATGV